MAAWTSRVDCREKVPELFEKEVASILRTKSAFPYMLYTPEFKSVHTVNPANLLVWDENLIYIFESAGHEIQKICYRIPDINYLEHGSILLNSWITLSGIINKKTLSTTVYFNTASALLFLPVVSAVRSIGKEAAQQAVTDVSVFDYLKDKNYKFMIYAANSLRPGQKVVSSVYEPAIFVDSSKSFTILNTTIISPKIFKSVLATSHIVVLTKDELIVLEEKPTVIPDEHVDMNKYSCITRYIPVNKIAKMNVGYYAEGEYLTFTLILTDYNIINLLFTQNNKENLEGLIAAFTSI
jgi:hypothetical protein